VITRANRHRDPSPIGRELRGKFIAAVSRADVGADPVSCHPYQSISGLFPRDVDQITRIGDVEQGPPNSRRDTGQHQDRLRGRRQTIEIEGRRKDLIAASEQKVTGARQPPGAGPAHDDSAFGGARRDDDQRRTIRVV
jgi:hypothetical protein